MVSIPLPKIATPPRRRRRRRPIALDIRSLFDALAVRSLQPQNAMQNANAYATNKRQRGTNPVYNVLPDIVGRLSVDENVAPAEYKKIMGEQSRKPTGAS